MADILRKQLFDTSRGRIVALLRPGGLTADDLASKLGLTRSAVRIQLADMERDGVVERVGKRPGTTRPSILFALTPEVDLLLSKAYVPLLTHLVQAFADGLPASQTDALLRQAGKGIAIDLTRGARGLSILRSRVARASQLLNEHLGAITHVEANGSYIIRGEACPLAALTGKHPSVCVAVESLVREVVGAPVRECCDRTERPRCCFEIDKGPA
jgi:predicted ArsR family transcriptional regulator